MLYVNRFVQCRIEDITIGKTTKIIKKKNIIMKNMNNEYT